MLVSATALFLGLAAAAPSGNKHVARTAPALTVGMQWDYPLGYTMTAAQANASVPFYAVDLFDTAASDIASMQANGHYVACYFSAGTKENWRPDANSFPPEAVGNADDGWDQEEWVDVRNTGLRAVMQKRIDLAKTKGCNGIDPDNIDGYDNDTGFDLTQQDAINYVKWMANYAASKGLATGQKNAGDIVTSLVSVCAWLIDESCVQYSECPTFKPYITAKKPVFHVEYYEGTPDNATKQKDCASGGVAGFSSIIKHLALDKYTYWCT